MSYPSPSPSSPEDGKHVVIGEKTNQVESDSGRQNVESNDEDDGPGTEEKPVEAPQPSAMTYLKGIEVLFIMLALVLSITLVSIDQVSPLAPSLFQSRLLPIYHTPVS